MIATIGRAGTLRKSHAAAAGHAFVGPGRYRRRCRKAASLACDGFMQNETVLTTARTPRSSRPGRPGPANALEVAGLRKSYGSVQAVRDISFTVAPGEIVALLGPNGAGKTTTLEILEGFRHRDGGIAEVLGLDPGDRSSAANCASGPGSSSRTSRSSPT